MATGGAPSAAAVGAAVLSSIEDGTLTDAFGRVRISALRALFASKQIRDNDSLFWDEDEVSGTGTSSSYSIATAATVLSVSATTAGHIVRQTYQRFNYQPGKSQIIRMTGVLSLSGSGAGNTMGLGLYDDDNGVFFRDNEGTRQVVIRSSVSGSAVDTAVDQSNWDDPMDGTGPSGITVDWTKAQIFAFDFEWLGVGAVRFCLDIDGRLYIVHQINHANNADAVYMSTPNLPLRYEIENDGTGAAGSVKTICTTVASEDGTEDLGVERWMSTGSGDIAASAAGTVYAVLGIRLKTTALGGVVFPRAISLLNSAGDDYEWLLLMNPTISGSPSWSDEVNMSIQSATGDTSGSPSATSVTALGHVMDGGYIKAGNQAGSLSAPIKCLRRIGAAIDGTRDELWLCVRPLSSNATILGGMSVREVA
jgi:hypothetical protein